MLLMESENQASPFIVICEWTMFGEFHKVAEYPTLKRAKTAAQTIGSRLQLCKVYDSNNNLVFQTEQYTNES